MDNAGSTTAYDPGPFRNADGTTVIGEDGGTVTGDGGVKAVVPDGTPIRVSAVAEENLGKTVPDFFTFLGCVEMEMGGVTADDELPVRPDRPLPASGLRQQLECGLSGGYLRPL